MRRRRTFFLLELTVVILLLSVAYASISDVTLQVTSNVTAIPNSENFKIQFSDKHNIETTVSNSNITVNTTKGTKTATINTGGYNSVGDYATVKIYIANNSSDLNTNLTFATTNDNEDYFKVTTSCDSYIASGDVTVLTIKIECIKTPITTQEGNFKITIIAAPQN